jgi:excisionase family DNA binding protein
MASPAAVPPQPNRAARRHPAKHGQRGYVGITEAATYLDVTNKTVRKLIATGELPAYRLGAKILRIKLADLDAVCKPLPSGAASARPETTAARPPREGNRTTPIRPPPSHRTPPA